MNFRNQIFLLVVSVAILFTSCNLLSDTSDSASDGKKSGSGSVLGDILNSVTGKLPLTQKNMVGTWNFQGTSCAFETENLLKKAGGAVVARQVEEKFDETCKELGIDEKNTGFVFKADSTYTGRIGGVKISGKYLLDTDTKKVRMSYLLGVGHLNASVAVSSREMKLFAAQAQVIALVQCLAQLGQEGGDDLLVADLLVIDLSLLQQQRAAQQALEGAHQPAFCSCKVLRHRVATEMRAAILGVVEHGRGHRECLALKRDQARQSAFGRVGDGGVGSAEIDAKCGRP